MKQQPVSVVGKLYKSCFYCDNGEPNIVLESAERTCAYSFAEASQLHGQKELCHSCGSLATWTFVGETCTIPKKMLYIH